MQAMAGHPRAYAMARRLAAKLREGAPYHTGSVVPNRMGLQLVRATRKHASWHLRPRHRDADIEEYVRTIDRDGIVVLPHFFSAQDFAAITDEFERSREQIPYRKDFDFATQVDERLFVEGSPHDRAAVATAREESVAIYEWPDLFPRTRALLPESSLVRSIVSAALRRTIRTAPQSLIQIWQRAAEGERLDPDVDRRRPRGEYMLHADTHYPTLKAWLYLSDIDESNGAFVYARGSHRMTWDRLRYEYDASIRVATSKKDGSWRTVPYGHIRGLTEEQMSGVTQTPVCGEANTLVIANTSGFHRRGEFTSDRPRVTIHLNFRNTEGLINRFPLPVTSLVPRARPA